MGYNIETFNIPDSYIKVQLQWQEVIHSMLVEEFNKNGLIYGGRRYYASSTGGSGGKLVAPDNNTLIGVDGRYTKLDNTTKQIVRDVIGRVHDGLYKETNKYILDKFDSLELPSIDTKSFNKLISVSEELVHDVRKQKAWLREVEKILKNAQKNWVKAAKENRVKSSYLTSSQLEDIGRAILGRAIELCPLETGFLRSSGRVYVYKNYIRIIFECPYAAYVHENINNVHPIGQAKFLETAAQEMLGNRSIWIEQLGATVEGTYIKQVWEHNDYGKAIGDPKWKLQTSYNAIYLDIDLNLNVNYGHYE